MACSACVFWVLGSPWAFTIVCEMPAALNALSRYGRSNCSQRTEDWVSGSSTATSPLPTLVLAEPPPDEDDDFFDEPHAASATAAIATNRTLSAHFLL